MSEVQTRGCRWYLLGGLLVGFLGSGMIAPPRGPAFIATWMLCGAALGLIAGLILDVRYTRRAR